MPLSDELGITESDLESVSPALRDKLTDRYAKIVGNRLLQTDAMLQDDHEYLKDLQRTASATLFSSDTHGCDDLTGQMEKEDGMRITILGDVQGDAAVKSLEKMTQQAAPTKPVLQPQPQPPQPHPPPQPARKTPWMQIASLAMSGATLAGLGYTGYQLSRPQYVDVPPAEATIDTELLSEIDAQLRNTPRSPQ